jgi:hypothetical protein
MGLEPITFGLKGHCYTIKLCDHNKQNLKKIKMEGFEPTTFGTQDRRSTAKLHLGFLNNYFYGSSGIRTHGFFISNCFQDRYHKPLGHTSLFIEYVGIWTQNLWFTRPLLYQLSYIFKDFLSLNGFEPLTSRLSSVHSTNWVISSFL